MNNKRHFAITLTILLLFATACGKNVITRYHSEDTVPRLVYVHDNVQGLEADDGLLSEKQIYTEVRTKKGDKESGILVDITKNDLVLSEGYYYSTVNDSTKRMESQVVIPKENIMILKVW